MSQSFQSTFSSVHLAYRTPSTYLPKAGDLDHVYLAQFQDISLQTCPQLGCQMVPKSGVCPLSLSHSHTTRLLAER